MLKLISLSQQAFHLGKRVHWPSAPGNSSPLPSSAQQPRSRASQSSRQPPRRTSTAPILRGLGRASGAAGLAGGGTGAPAADRVKSCRALAALEASGTLTPAPGAGVTVGDSPGRGAAAAPRAGVVRKMVPGATRGDPQWG